MVAGLHEHDRRNTPYLANKQDFEAAIANCFAQPDTLVFGNETAQQALHRFTDAVALVCKGSTSNLVASNLVVVSHGIVISLFVAAHNGINAFAFWKGLAMPDCVVLRLPDFSLVRRQTPDP